MIDNVSLPVLVTGSAANKEPAFELSNSPVTIDVMQKHYIDELMRKYNGNKSMVAKDLGISRTTLWRRLRETAHDH